MPTVSVFKGTVSNESFISSPEQVVELIYGDTFAEFISYLRSLSKKEYDAEKKQLTAVTWSGTFKEGTRSKETMTSYSNLIVLDIDHLDENTLVSVKTQMLSEPFVRYCFVSPSGQGLKIVVEVNTGQEHHRAAFLHLQKFFEDKYFIKIDKSGKDECRLCYLSYDPQIIINPNSQIFEVDIRYGDIITEFKNEFSGADVTSIEVIFKVCVKWIERNYTFVEGQRNVFIHSLACALNRCGVSQENAIILIGANYVTPDIKWHQSVRSAYFHNQHEYNTVKVKELGNASFEAPPHIPMSDDVVIDNVMRITSTLYWYKVPNEYILAIVNKICIFYESKGYLDFSQYSIREIMNKAVEKLQESMAQQAQQFTLNYQSAEDMIYSILATGGSENCISTGFPEFDNEMFGGLQMGNSIGLIGMGESYKSVIAQRICFINAMKGIPSVYLNGEMSLYQFYERLIHMAFGINLREAISNGTINANNAKDYVERVKQITGNNIFVFNGSGHNKKSVLATMDHIYSTTGKKIKLLISDGLTQWDWQGKEEINATINNSMIAKEVAKEANGGEGIAHIVLIHISGNIKRWFRNTDDYVRGGKKVLANLDAYFCTSRLIDPVTNTMVNEDDVVYIQDKFYLRYVDKRSRTGTINKIVDVMNKLELRASPIDPSVYELKINKPKA